MHSAQADLKQHDVGSALAAMERVFKRQCDELASLKVPISQAHTTSVVLADFAHMMGLESRMRTLPPMLIKAAELGNVRHVSLTLQTQQ